MKVIAWSPNLTAARAAEFGADLLVMGAFGRSRWRSMILGGVTRSILAEMTLPVLISR